MTLGHLLVAVPWFAMIMWPNGPLTVSVVRSSAFVAGLCGLYGLMLVPLLPLIVPVLLNPSPESVAQGLGNPAGATLGWIHFLAFDLYVGRQIYSDLIARGPVTLGGRGVLFLTLMAGPLGLLAHLVQARLWDRDGYRAG